MDRVEVKEWEIEKIKINFSFLQKLIITKKEIYLINLFFS